MRASSKFLCFFIISIFPFVSCTTSKRHNSYVSKYHDLYNDEKLDEVEETTELSAEGGEITDEETETEEKIASEDSGSDSEARSNEEIIADQQSHVTFPLVYTPIVGKWINYFQGKGRRNFVKWLGRSTRYLEIMEEAIDKYNLPKELVYLSMIESGFNNRAYSSAHAVGMWQFIRSTGRLYGLQIDWWIDERRDPYKAADAAARHLRDLYKEFDNWYLAVAAYNAGPGKIRKAVRMYGTENFWELTRKRKKYLKPETKNYVPKLIAAAMISKNLKKFGFSEKEITYQTPLKYDTYKVSVPIDLYQVAKLSGTSVSAIKDLNPELRRNMVPPGASGYELKIPKGKHAYFDKKFASVKHKFSRKRYVTHRVRRGETLNKIARTYGVSIASIKEMNRIRNSRYIQIGQNLMIPPGGRVPQYIAQNSAPAFYKIRRGDTLGKIAKRYRVSVASLKNANNIRNVRSISVGKTLKIPGGSVSTNKVVAANSKYRVKSGDTLAKIAKQHGVSIASLKQTNNIRNVHALKVGQVLNVGSTSSSNMVHHVVRRGENLTEISEKYNVSMKKLLIWNQLSKGSVIKPGQKLKVFVTQAR